MKIYFNEKRDFFYEGQIVTEFDIHGSIIEDVKINKFFLHYKKDKTPFVCVNFNSLQHKTKNWTLDADCLGDNYRTSIERVQ